MTITPSLQRPPKVSRVSIPVGTIMLLCQPSPSPSQTPIGPQPYAVVTHHNDNARTGVNPAESILNPANVHSFWFQLLYKLPVTGQVYAQPLFVPGVRIPSVPYPAIHNLIVVATQQNELTVWDHTADEYAARDGHTPEPLKIFSLGAPVPYNYMPLAETKVWFTCPTPPVLNDMCNLDPDVSPPPTPTVANPTTGFPYTVFPWIGVTSTPVVDTTTMRLYVVAMNWTPRDSVAFRLYCFDLTHLRFCTDAHGEPIGAVTIAGQVSGSSADNINGIVRFNPQVHFQRPALLLANGRVYIGFGTHSEWPTWHGWMFAYDASTLQQKGVWCSTPNGGGAGIWQAGAGPAADEKGNLYIMTGNADNVSAATWTAPRNYPMSFVKLDPNLGVLASFPIPFAKKYSDATMDLGSSGPVLLGPNTVVGAGKQGILYNLDRNLVERQEFQAAAPANGDFSIHGSAYHHVHGVPVAWRDPTGRMLVYLWGERDSLKMFAWDDNTARFDSTHLQASEVVAPGTYNNFIPMPTMPGGALSLSTNGALGGAILWASINREMLNPVEDASGASSPALRSNANPQIVAGVLRAFDAENLKTELWESDEFAFRDSVGRFAKSTPPTVTYGRVFLATAGNAVNVYGLLNGASLLGESVNGQATPSKPSILRFAVKSGQSFNAKFVIVNTGLTLWTANHYALVSQADVHTIWGPSSVPVPKDVASYETVQIDFNAVAPLVSRRTMIPFVWQMAKDGVTFGDYTANVAIDVLVPSQPPSLSVEVRLISAGAQRAISATVIDDATAAPVGGASVAVLDVDGAEQATGVTDGNGTLRLTYKGCYDAESHRQLSCGGTASKSGYPNATFKAP